MTPLEWAAIFAQQDTRAVEQQRAVMAALAEKVNSIHVSTRDVNAIQILEPGRESDSYSGSVAKSVQAATVNGWTVRVVVSLVAHPTKGIVSVETLRARRHDEAVFAAWWSGALDCAWYFGPTGTERLGGVDLGVAPVASGPVPIVSLTVAQMLDVAKAAGLVIPSKERKRDQIIAALIDHGIVTVDPPRPLRSILDVFDGLQLTRH